MSQVMGPTQRHRHALLGWLMLGVIVLVIGVLFVPGGYWILGPLALIALVECVRRAFQPQAGVGRKGILAFGALVATFGLLVWVFLLIVGLQGGFD
jgi:hypothetical protein